MRGPRGRISASASPRRSTSQTPSPGHDYKDLLSSLPPTSWLYSNQDDHFPATINQDDDDMESPMLTTVPVLPKLRTIRFDPVVSIASPDERYLSSEEEASSSGDESAPGSDRWDPPRSDVSDGMINEEGIDNDVDDDGEDDGNVEDGQSQFIIMSALDVDEQVARTITFIAPGKPRLIDVNTFAPVHALYARAQGDGIGRRPEPPVRRRIRENRELDRILKSRSWISKAALSQDDLYRPRRLTAAPLQSTSGNSSQQHDPRPKLRGRGNKSVRALGISAAAAAAAESSVLAGCDPMRLKTKPSKLRGVARSLVATKRHAPRLAEALC